MTSKDSPVIEFYPTKFKQFSITNGKWDDPKAWIHTVLLPFIDKVHSELKLYVPLRKG